jgi:hypothetical protein
VVWGTALTYTLILECVFILGEILKSTMVTRASAAKRVSAKTIGADSVLLNTTIVVANMDNSKLWASTWLPHQSNGPMLFLVMGLLVFAATLKIANDMQTTAPTTGAPTDPKNKRKFYAIASIGALFGLVAIASSLELASSGGN